MIQIQSGKEGEHVGELREAIRASLERHIAESGYSQKEIAEKLGVSKSSVTNWIKGKNSPDVELVLPICKLLNISVREFYGEPDREEPLPIKKSPSDLSEAGTKKTSLYSSEAMRLAEEYDQRLDRWGREQIRSVMDHELARCDDESRFLEETRFEETPKVIPLYYNPAAAGLASPIFGEDYDEYELQPEDPQGAMFAVRVQGDSMEPHFPDGSTVVCNKDPLSDGDIGVFSVDGGMVVKQYHYDPFLGIAYLFSLNRARADADVLITPSSGQTLMCMGRVITKRRFSLPL